MPEPKTPDAVHAYWFGTIENDARTAEERAQQWWQKSDGTDRDIRDRFETWVQAAGRGELDAWADGPTDRLALIVLLDQFPRNIYRGLPAAFRYDEQALSLSLEGQRLGQDRALRPVERVFFYLPMEHAESRAMQARSVALFEALLAGVPEAQQAPFETFLDYAVRHRDVIERFGRFPHRNATLGRTSTAEEAAFLEQPGSGF